MQEKVRIARNATITHYLQRQTDRQTDKTFILLSHVHDIQGITY